MVGDDRGRPFHDGHPVGISGSGDEDRTVDEAVDVARALDQADTASNNRVTDRKARGKFLTFADDPVRLERCRFAPRLDR